MYKSNQKVFLGMLLGGILLFFFLLFSTSVKNNLLEYAQGYLKRDTSWALEERLDGWSASLEAVSESYIFGYGIGDSQKVRDKYFYIHGFDVGIDNEYNSHNQYIEILIIGGIFGLILFLSMYFKLILLYLKTFNTNILCFFLLLFVIMITESILVRQHGIVFFSFFYMLFNIRIDEKKG
ncbi:O-antigen ligase [Aquimarina sp. EL_43]|nr:O-antigen ligase [Aquimarina sp. EL_35]MBG6152173.1 O-antigen ligase [Aquimarina sp. EL_32]MBG6169883.1 O-antigen ligase [Aquimarina sp. EL_43]